MHIIIKCIISTILYIVYWLQHRYKLLAQHTILSVGRYNVTHCVDVRHEDSFLCNSSVNYPVLPQFFYGSRQNIRISNFLLKLCSYFQWNTISRGRNKMRTNSYSYPGKWRYYGCKHGQLSLEMRRVYIRIRFGSCIFQKLWIRIFRMSHLKQQC